MTDWGNIPAGSVIPFIFSTYGKTNGESITLSGLAVTDIEVYKGTSMTQRSSDAGYTLLDTDGTDIDSITGIHGFSIDTGDNTDAGFYAAGSFYTVVVSSVTVDSQTVNFVAGTFRLTTAEGTAGVANANVSHISDDSTAANNLELLVEDGPGYVRKNTAQAGGAATITLDASASASNDFYNGDVIFLLSGTGALQARVIIDYVGATKVATVGETWVTTPDATSVFMILPSGNAVSDVNVTQISGDSAAADNAEAFFDGTGYNGGAGQVVVDSVTGTLSDLTTAIADSVPADGSLPSIRQALYMITQFLLEKSVSGTTVTVKKADGSTTLLTLTINDANSPTSITRTT